MSQSKLIGIIGVGSSFGADCIAQHIIQLLQKKINVTQFKNNIFCDYYDRPGFYLLECIKKFETVHLIDAVMGEKKIGTLYRFDHIHAFKKNNLMLSSHGMGVAETLLLGEALNCLPSKIIIHGIEINATTDLNSDEIQRASDQLVENILGELKIF